MGLKIILYRARQTEGGVELEPLPSSLSAIEAEQDDGEKDD
jgi:hypothetical protein